MKLYAILIFTALGMTFLAARFVYVAKDMVLTMDDRRSIEEIPRVRKLLSSKVQPKVIIEADELFASKELLTDFVIQNDFFSSYAKSRKINFSKANDCKSRDVPPVFDLSGSPKFFIWEEFLCNPKLKLGHGFFKNPPYMHPSGQSYVFLAIQSGQSEYIDEEWINANLSFVHILELDDIFEINHKIINPYKALGKMNDFDRTSDQVKSFITDGILYFKKRGIKIMDGIPLVSLTYYGRDLDDVNKALQFTPFNISKFVADKKCVIREGNLCWRYNIGHLFGLASRTTLIFLVLSIISIFLVVWILFRKIRQQKEEEERKKFALQVLSHEFRTPVTNMILLNEQLMRDIRSLPEEVQNNLYDMAANIFRMQRLTEKSRSYLKMTHEKSSGEMELIDDIDFFVKELLEEYSDREQEIEFQGAGIKRSIYSDPYLLSICIKNLVENAFNHGTAPFKVFIRFKKEHVEIGVQDSGDDEHLDLKQLIQEFHKGSRSEGSGLGLNIVSNAIRNLNGELILKMRPTTFIIKLKQKAQK